MQDRHSILSTPQATKRLPRPMLVLAGHQAVQLRQNVVRSGDLFELAPHSLPLRLVSVGEVYAYSGSAGALGAGAAAVALPMLLAGVVYGTHQIDTPLLSSSDTLGRPQGPFAASHSPLSSDVFPGLHHRL